MRKISNSVKSNNKMWVLPPLFIFFALFVLGGCKWSQPQTQVLGPSKNQIPSPNNSEAVVKLEPDDPRWPTRPKGDVFRIWVYREDRDISEYCKDVIEPLAKPTCNNDFITVAWQTGDALPNCHHNGMWIFLDEKKAYAKAHPDISVFGKGDLLPDNLPCFASITDVFIYSPVKIHGLLQIIQPFVSKDPTKLSEAALVFSDEIEIDGASLGGITCFGAQPCPTDVPFPDVSKVQVQQKKDIDEAEILKTLFSDKNDFGDYEYDDPRWPTRPDGKAFRIWVYPTAYMGLDAFDSTSMRIKWQTGKELPHCRSGIWTAFSYSEDYKSYPWLRPMSHVGPSSIADEGFSKSDPIPDNKPCTSKFSWEEEPYARSIDDDGSLFGAHNAVIQILQPFLDNQKLGWTLSDKVSIEGRTLKGVHCFGSTPCPIDIPFDDIEITP